MMHLFKQASKFAAVKGKVFGKGQHHVSEEMQKDPYFKLLKKAGLIVPVEADKVSAPLPSTMKEVAEKLVTKVTKEAAMKLAVAPDADSSPAVETKKKAKG